MPRSPPHRRERPVRARHPRAARGGDGEIVVTNSFGMDVALACDCVVDASTMSPNTALADELSGEFDVHVIGDAAEPLSIQNAITTGNLTARNC